MANEKKLREIKQLFKQEIDRITSDANKWMKFLSTASRLYKYDFEDQILLYAQRPDATACAEMSLWNEKMNRWVKRGAKGIALIDKAGRYEKLRYVFDVLDTRTVNNISRSPKLWVLDRVDREKLAKHLVDYYSLDAEKIDLASVLWHVAKDQVEEQFEFYFEGMAEDNVGTGMEFLSETEQKNIFQLLMTDSISYMLMRRCNLNPLDYYQPLHFEAIRHMKSISALSHLGVGINELAGAVFREIGRTVREINLEKEKQENKVAKTEKAGYNDFNTLIRDKTEKEANHGADANRGNQGNGGRREEDPIQTGGGLPDPESQMQSSVTREHWEVRSDEKGLSEEAQESTVFHQAHGGHSDGTFTGSTDESGKTGGDVGESVSPEISGSGQRSTPDGMGAVHEHGTDDGRGSGSSGGYLQLNLFPSVEEQLGTIAAAEAGMKITEPAAFFMQDEIIDAVLRTGGGKENSRFRIYAKYQQGKTPKEMERFLVREYGDTGKGFLIEGLHVTVWFNSDGMRIAGGTSAKVSSAFFMSWQECETCIRGMVEDGKYLDVTDAEKIDAIEKQRVAAMIYFFFRDGVGKLPTELGNGNNFPDSTAMIEKLLAGREGCQKILELVNAVEENQLPRYLAKPEDIKRELEGFIVEKKIYPLNPHLDIMQESFITQDEIDWIIQRGSLVQDGKGRIYKYFSEDHTEKEKVEFLKNEYGSSGRSDALPGSDQSWMQCDARGLQLLKGDIIAPYTQITLKWNIVAKRIQKLIREEAYLTSEEQRTYQTARGQKEAELESLEEEKLGPHYKESGQEESFEAAGNYHFGEDVVEAVGAREQFRRNVNAIRVLKSCEYLERSATLEEQKILSMYAGWGGIPDAFDENKEGWTKEYQELKALINEDEYEAARASTLNAHFTSPMIIRAIYKKIEEMGFQKGNILEPAMGTGNFFGALPESMTGARLYGVELDSLTGRIARLLYPKAEIQISGFEKTDFQDDFFDIAVGNVPFGNYQVADKRYDNKHFLIHDYFLAKALDKVRAGGVIAFITSKGTMDKANPKVRQYLAERAELLGAVRLPNTAFKANAGTEVTTDILFLKKRERPVLEEPDWIYTEELANGVPVNAYFVRHPEMILGEMTEVIGPYGKETTCREVPGKELEELLETAMSAIHGRIEENILEDDNLIEQDDTVLAAPGVRNYTYTVYQGEIYYRVNSRMEHVKLPNMTKERIKGMVGIRDCTRELIDAQKENEPDKVIQILQTRLSELYDEFTKDYGLLNSSANKRAFSNDSSYCLLASLEIVDEEGNLKRKADMFTKRTIRQAEPVTKVDSASEALTISISEKAKVDLEYMSTLYGKEEEIIAAELEGVIFKNPDSGKWETSDQYLSGNIRKKLETARREAVLHPEYRINVDALEKVQPVDLDASEIYVRLGSAWIEPEIYRQFLFELLEPSRNAQENITVKYSKDTGAWNIEGKSYDRYNINASSVYGTERADAYRLMEDSLNLRETRITDREYVDGKERYVLNRQETMLAGQKQEAIKEAFSEWIFQNPERRENICRQYNELFNSVRPREYDGSYLTFPGMSPEITLMQHQKNGVARILLGGNTLLAHVVGAGKTFSMIAGAMEKKRLGLCRKSMFLVPNHLTEQWGADFLRLYPGANILVATKRDFEPTNRRKFCARIATGEYDAVIIGHSQFGKIPLSEERMERFIKNQIREVTEAIAASDGESRFTVKELEKTKKMLEAKLAKLYDQEKKDDLINFEELGVDSLFVDESQAFKNLAFYTKMRNVAGIAQTESQRASDLFSKIRYIDELTGNRGVCFGTGTPISNSIAEMYTVMRYLEYDRLAEMGLGDFDSWASTFGETKTVIEFAQVL